MQAAHCNLKALQAVVAIGGWRCRLAVWWLQPLQACWHVTFPRRGGTSMLGLVQKSRFRSCTMPASSHTSQFQPPRNPRRPLTAPPASPSSSTVPCRRTHRPHPTPSDSTAVVRASCGPSTAQRNRSCTRQASVAIHACSGIWRKCASP